VLVGQQARGLCLRPDRPEKPVATSPSSS
jgi:hypothetical protein